MTEKVFLGELLVDGTGREPVPKPALVVKDGRIEEVRTRDELPTKAERVDFGGLTFVPGLIESHGHLVLSGGPDAVEVLLEEEISRLLGRPQLGHNLREVEMDLVVTVGGDGTILRASSLVGRLSFPAPPRSLLSWTPGN